jgi:hypothetical protein
VSPHGLWGSPGLEVLHGTERRSKGRTVLGVARVVAAVTDLALGPDDSVFVAAIGDGVLKLSSQVDALDWSAQPGFGR